MSEPDFLSRLTDPEMLAQERLIAQLGEALYALLQAVESGAITEGDINQAQGALDALAAREAGNE